MKEVSKFCQYFKTYKQNKFHAQLHEKKYNLGAQYCFRTDGNELFCFVQEEDLTDMLSIGTRIEEKYGHLFDAIIINDNVVEASKELLAVIDQLETRPQWVPITWVQWLKGQQIWVERLLCVYGWSLYILEDKLLWKAVNKWKDVEWETYEMVSWAQLLVNCIEFR